MTNTANILQPFPSLKLKPKFLIHEPERLRSEPLYFYIRSLLPTLNCTAYAAFSCSTVYISVESLQWTPLL